MVVILLMDKILHDPKDPKLGELWYIPYYGSCRILSINSSSYNCTPFLHSLLTKGKLLLNRAPKIRFVCCILTQCAGVHRQKYDYLRLQPHGAWKNQASAWDGS